MNIVMLMKKLIRIFQLKNMILKLIIQIMIWIKSYTIYRIRKNKDNKYDEKRKAVIQNWINI